MAVALDGKKTNLGWLASVWDHRDEWPNVTDKYRNVCQLQLEVERNLIDQVRHDLLLYIYVPLECGLQAATVVFGVACKFCTGKVGDLVHRVPSMKVVVVGTCGKSGSVSWGCHGRWFGIGQRWYQ